MPMCRSKNASVQPVQIMFECRFGQEFVYDDYAAVRRRNGLLEVKGHCDNVTPVACLTKSLKALLLVCVIHRVELGSS